MLVQLLISAALAAGFPSIDQPHKAGARATTDAAVVIGIEDYPFISDVPYAKRDAQVFSDFLIYTRGVPLDRVTLIKDRASRELILEAVDKAATSVGAGGTLWVYFAGHGAASSSNGERMILGVDVMAEASAFEARSVKLSELRSRVKSKAVFVMDTCYSGVGRAGGQLLAGTRFAMPSYAFETGKEILEWTAAGPGELAGPLSSVQHGAFTYFVVGALRGWADGQLTGVPDGTVTAEEGQLYVSEAMRQANIPGQTPHLAGVALADWKLSTGKLDDPPGVEKREAPPVAPIAPPAVGKREWVKVDLHRALSETAEGKRWRADLQKDFDNRQALLNQEQARLQEKQARAAILNEQALKELQQEIGELQQMFVRMQQELATIEATAVEGLLPRVLRATDDLAAQRGVAAFTGSASFPFPGAEDLTDAVIQHFDSYLWETRPTPPGDEAIGFVDLGKLAKAHPEAAALQERTRVQSEEYDARMAQLQSELPSMSDAQKQQEHAQLQSDYVKLQQEVAAEDAKLMASFMARVQALYAKRPGVVLLDQTRPAGPHVDLTDDAMKRLPTSGMETLPTPVTPVAVYVGMQRLLMESAAGKAEQTKLMRLKESGQAELDAAQARYNELLPAKQAAAGQALQARYVELEAQLQTEEQAATQRVMAALEPALTTLQKEKGLPMFTDVRPAGAVLDLTELMLSRVR